jgi:rRNA processing protein Gar1
MKFESFVYKWTHNETKKCYIGKHKGTIDDGYISSSKEFNRHYRSNPTMYEREIIFHGDDGACYKLEAELIAKAYKDIGYDLVFNISGMAEKAYILQKSQKNQRLTRLQQRKMYWYFRNRQNST